MVRSAEEGVRLALGAALAALLACGVACDKKAPEPSGASPAPQAQASGPSPLVLAPGVRMVKPDSGDAADLIKRQVAREKADGRTTLVYVGATWCEPCQRFHEAAKKGELDAEFPRLTIIEFDADHDRDRIAAAGYASEYIPLFVKPGPDGRGSKARFSGSVKGPYAIPDLTKKLKALLADESS
jgi:thiol-disulfide isomerase/thioredoxin